MHARTLATIKQLEDVEWFTNVGIRDTEYAVVLSSWDEAIRSCSSVEWENHLLEGANEHSARLIERNQTRFNQWNAIVDDVKRVVLPFVERKTRDVIVSNKLPKVFRDTVNWDIVSLCMEAEYADVYPPGFYASQAHWYLKGHFPCGWNGMFPEGKIVIY